MNIISKEKFEEMITEAVEKTGIPESLVRLFAEYTVESEGLQIEDDITISLFNHFLSLKLH